jgi:glycine cleavage system transcriptional repressor
MSHLSITAVGADRPGIVAAVSKVLVDHGCNIEDSAMTILGGQFAMMLVVAAPAGTEPSDLDAALVEATGSFGLVVTVRPISVAGASAVGAPARFTLSVHGADRPGIVHGISSVLAGAGVNIVDLSTRVIGAPNEPVYVMVLEVELPDSLADEDLRAQLDTVAAELGVRANLHPSDADIL